MKRTALLATLFMSACASEPALLDEVAQDIGPAPAYARASDGLSLDQLIAIYCPGVERRVPTYRGLSGTYQRLGLTTVGEPYRLTLDADVDDLDASGTFTGTYTGTDGTPVPYDGEFAALADNPAIGPAIAFDIDPDAEGFEDVYFVLGIRRSFGLVRSLCLGGEERPFLLARSYF
jgi:hypothetical protein